MRSVGSESSSVNTFYRFFLIPFLVFIVFIGVVYIVYIDSDQLLPRVQLNVIHCTALPPRRVREPIILYPPFTPFVPVYTCITIAPLLRSTQHRSPYWSPYLSA